MRFFSKTKLIILSIITILLFSNLAYGDEIESKTIQQDGILETINSEQFALDELSNQYTAAIIKQQTLKDNLKDTKKEIKKLKKEIKKEQIQLEKQTVIAYKDGKIPALDIILDSSSFEAFTTNVDFCCRYMNQTNTIIQKKKSLESAKKEQEAIQKQQLEKLEQAIQEMEEAKIKAEGTIQDLQSQYEQLDEEIAILVLQQQLTSNQSVPIEEFDNYITDNATDILSSGNAAAEI